MEKTMFQTANQYILNPLLAANIPAIRLDGTLPIKWYPLN